jgi:branched-chain amino acid aminotransferase
MGFLDLLYDQNAFKFPSRLVEFYQRHDSCSQENPHMHLHSAARPGHGLQSIFDAVARAAFRFPLVDRHSVPDGAELRLFEFESVRLTFGPVIPNIAVTNSEQPISSTMSGSATPKPAELSASNVFFHPLPPAHAPAPGKEIHGRYMLTVPWSRVSGWGQAKISPRADLSFDPLAGVLQYAVTCFEGMKVSEKRLSQGCCSERVMC